MNPSPQHEAARRDPLTFIALILVIVLPAVWFFLGLSVNKPSGSKSR